MPLAGRNTLNNVTGCSAQSAAGLRKIVAFILPSQNRHKISQLAIAKTFSEANSRPSPVIVLRLVTVLHRELIGAVL